jgi:hypothetical protein
MAVAADFAGINFFVPYLLLIYLTIGYERVKRPLMQRLYKQAIG